MVGEGELGGGSWAKVSELSGFIMCGGYVRSSQQIVHGAGNLAKATKKIICKTFALPPNIWTKFTIIK